MSKNNLLQKPPNVIQEIRKIYNLNEPSRLEDAIQILKKWIEQENHILKKDFNNRYLERALIVSKGSIERAKKKIDAFCTVRTLMPSFFTINESKMEFEKLLKAMNVILLPKLTEDFYRFVIVKAENQNFDQKHIFMLMQYSIMLLEYMCEHDYSNGLIFLLDYQDLNLFDFVSSLSLTDLRMFASISLKGYGSRLKELHIISQSKAVDLLINIMKQFFSHKIENNIYVYKNREEMLGKDFYFRDILPKEYGGKERPTQMITKDWLDEIFSKENLDTFKLMSKAGTEEKLRLSSKFNEDYMGTPGSFRNLRVD